MKHRCITLALFLALGFLVLFSSTSMAEERKSEWNDKTYDFAKITKVLLISEMSKPSKIELIEKRKIDDQINDLFRRDKTRDLKENNIEIITLSELHNLIQQTVGENMSDLLTNDKEKYDLIMKERLSNYVQCTLELKIVDYGYTHEYVPERVETYIDYVETKVSTSGTNADGKKYTEIKTITIPIEKVRVVPAYYSNTAHAGVEFTLTDAKTSQSIWQLQDIREATGKNPIDMIERIFKRSIDKFSDLKPD